MRKAKKKVEEMKKRMGEEGATRVFKIYYKIAREAAKIKKISNVSLLWI